MAEQHTGDSAGDMPTPGRLVLAPAVRAVAGTACSVLPLRSPTGLAPPTTLSQSRRGRPVSHAGRLPPRGLGLPLPENGELAAPGRWVLQKPLLDGLLSTPSCSQWSASHVDSPLRCGRPSPSAAGTPQAVHAEAWGGGSADPSRSGPGLLLPAHSGRPRAYVYFVKKASSLQNQNVPVRPASDRQRLLHAACALGVESGLVFREHPVLAEPSCSTVTVVLGGRNQDLREVPHRHVWPPDVTA